MAKKVKKEKATSKVTREEKKQISKAQKEDEEKVVALLSYLVLILGAVFVLLTKKDRTEYSIYHAKQGIVLFIALVFVILFGWILSFVPLLGWLLEIIAYMLWATLWIIGMLNALKMKKIPLPIIGEYGKNIKL